MLHHVILADEALATLVAGIGLGAAVQTHMTSQVGLVVERLRAFLTFEGLVTTVLRFMFQQHLLGFESFSTTDAFEILLANVERLVVLCQVAGLLEIFLALDAAKWHRCQLRSSQRRSQVLFFLRRPRFIVGRKARRRLGRCYHGCALWERSVIILWHLRLISTLILIWDVGRERRHHVSGVSCTATISCLIVGCHVQARVGVDRWKSGVLKRMLFIVLHLWRQFFFHERVRGRRLTQVTSSIEIALLLHDGYVVGVSVGADMQRVLRIR